MQYPKKPNIVSVSWGDHLIFGEGDGRLETVSALGRQMQNWKTELGAGIVHWRCTRNRISGKYFQGRGYRHFYRSRTRAIQWDDLKEVTRLARDLDMKVFLCVTLFDEGWPLLPKKVRDISYHNNMHCQHVTSDYQPVFQGSNTRLYLARQWQPRSAEEEKTLLANPCVAGLVFSSFRHDNPGPVRRNDWNV